VLKTPKSPLRRREWEQKTLRPGSTHQVRINLRVNVNNTSLGWEGVTKGQPETIAVKSSSERFGLKENREEYLKAG